MSTTSLKGCLDWPGAEQVVRVVRSRTQKGETSTETACFITSLDRKRGNAKTLATLIRGHWSIENGLHWVRDVTFGEDACRVRTGDAAQVLAATRNAVIGVLNLNGCENKATAQRRYAVHPREALALIRGEIEN